MMNKKYPSSNYSRTNTPSLNPTYHTPATHPTTTHEFIGAYFIQIPPPPGWPGIFQDDSNKVLKSIEK